MSNQTGYQPPSDDFETLFDQIEQAWLWLVKGGGYPGQSPYRDRLVELIVKAAEQEWLLGARRELTADALLDRFTARYGELLNSEKAETQLEQIHERWQHWSEFLEVTIPARLLEFREA